MCSVSNPHGLSLTSQTLYTGDMDFKFRPRVAELPYNFSKIHKQCSMLGLLMVNSEIFKMAKNVRKIEVGNVQYFSSVILCSYDTLDMTWRVLHSVVVHSNGRYFSCMPLHTIRELVLKSAYNLIIK